MNQLIGALPVAISYCMSLLGKLSSRSPASFALSAGGAGLLAYVTLVSHDWGFLLVDTTGWPTP